MVKRTSDFLYYPLHLSWIWSSFLIYVYLMFSNLYGRGGSGLFGVHTEWIGEG
jgi:hypothetical protein